VLANAGAAEVFVNSASPRILGRVYRAIRDRLEGERRRRLLKSIVPRIARASLALTQATKRRGSRGTTGYNPGDDAWDLESTIERILETPRSPVTYSHIRCKSVGPPKLAACLIIDKSQSVTGVIDDVVIACAAVCHGLREEMVSVVIFDKEAEVIRRFDCDEGLERVIELLLEMDSGGATDLLKPLATAAEELRRAPVSCAKLGVLISDLAATRGASPCAVAREIPSLRIVRVPGCTDELPESARELCRLRNVDLVRTCAPGDILDAILEAFDARPSVGDFASD
jgi:hypothetical protein